MKMLIFFTNKKHSYISRSIMFYILFYLFYSILYIVHLLS